MASTTAPATEGTEQAATPRERRKHLPDLEIGADAWPNAKANIRLTTGGHPPSLAEFDPYATLNLDGGPFGVQIYLPPDQLRTIAAGLLAAADALDAAQKA